MKIRILTQNPFSVWFWWVEIQATQYMENIKKLDPSMDISFFNWIEKDFDVLHVIWIHTWINPYWIDVLKSKWVKIVVSPVFYLKPNYLFDFRRPLVYRLFSYIPHHIINWMKQLVLKSDLLLPNSTDEANQLEEVFWVDRRKMKVLYNWVSDNYFEWVPPELFKKTYDVEDYILSVSHIEPRKNHLNLIKWFLEYKKRNNSKLKLVLLWDYRGNYFKYHNEIKNLIGKNKDIIHVNNLKSIDEVFKAAYLWSKAHFLLSSLETPWLSNIEAWLAWNKLVLWDCGPVREYFKGFATYINPKKMEDIVSQIELLDSDSRLEQIEFIREKYTWEEITKQLLSFYKILWNQM